MKTTLHLDLSHPQALPAAFQEEDMRYPESLEEKVVYARSKLVQRESLIRGDVQVDAAVLQG